MLLGRKTTTNNYSSAPLGYRHVNINATQSCYSATVKSVKSAYPCNNTLLQGELVTMVCNQTFGLSPKSQTREMTIIRLGHYAWLRTALANWLVVQLKVFRVPLVHQWKLKLWPWGHSFSQYTGSCGVGGTRPIPHRHHRAFTLNSLCPNCLLPRVDQTL